MPQREPIHLEPDPVIEAYKKDVDRTLIYENLKRSPTARLQRLMSAQSAIEEMQRAVKAARAARR